jgi:ribulose-bisphosphate carboxylase large chain
MHAVIDRHPKHGIHFRVLAKCCACRAATTCTQAPSSASSKATATATSAGSTRCATRSFVPEDRSRGIFFDQDWGRCPASCRLLRAVSMSGTCRRWSTIFGDDCLLQFGGGTLGHPWGNAAGAAANRVAVEACVKARNEGRELEKEGKDILTKRRHSPPS